VHPCTGTETVQAVRPIGGVEVWLYSFLTTVLEGGEGSVSRLNCSLPLGETRYPLYRMLGGPQGQSGQVWNISPPTRIWSPDRPARSQSLYQLHYLAHEIIQCMLNNQLKRVVYYVIAQCVCAPGIYMVSLRNTMENLNQLNTLPVQNRNAAPLNETFSFMCYSAQCNLFVGFVVSSTSWLK